MDLRSLPISVLTDSYKAGHFKQYPKAQKMIAYGEFRQAYGKDSKDTRLLFYGMRYIVQNYLERQWTESEVEKAAKFYSTHLAPANSEYFFPKELMLSFVRENNGYFPVKLQALPEASAIHARVPVYQITASGKYTCLCTYLETLLTMVWYQSTVATLSRRARDRIEAGFEASAEGGAASPLVASRLHDFGMRGCSGLEQTVLGGTSHLLNFDGSDTLSAAYYAQFELNDGRPVASSVPATEHSVMTAWRTEQEAISNMIQQYGQGLFACVMDSYDYGKALSEVLPAIAQEKVEKGGFMILRPDSGDPVEAVLQALQAAERVFGVTVNSKGYKVPKGCGVIQGDGINLETLGEILDAVLEAGFSAEAVAFGMGAGLLQKLNRDTMSFATKLSYIKYEDGQEAEVMKNPVGGGKSSFPGALAVKRVQGIPTAFPEDAGLVTEQENMLQTVYDNGPCEVAWKSFDDLRKQIQTDWDNLPPTAEVISPELKHKTEVAVKNLRKGQHIQ